MWSNEMSRKYVILPMFNINIQKSHEGSCELWEL
jgi:hypothetical protein